MDPDRRPSEPPSPGRPMSFLVAAVWTIGALACIQALALLVASIRPRARLDLVSGALCEAAAFVAGVFFVVRVHVPERDLREALGVRPSPGGLLALAAALGVALHVPVDALADAIERRWPTPSEDLAALAEAFSAPTPLRRIGLVVAVGCIGPLVEELFFRGAIYGTLRRGHAVVLAASGTALLFALAHREPRDLGPVLAVSAVLTWSRAVSGSLLEPLLLHMTFNCTTVLSNLTGLSRVGHVPAPPSALWLGGGLAVTAALGFAYHRIAIRSAECARGRELDGG